MWWRDGGDLSKPLLSNPQFYERFRKRLQHLAEEVFTDAVFGKEIESIRESIAPEVKLRALTLKQDPTSAEQRFNETMDVFHEHLSLRRAWVLKELQAE